VLIKALHFRKFRGLQSTGLSSCSGFNVLIGKNNAGKSSVLAGLERVLEHLELGRFSFLNSVERPRDEFTHRKAEDGFQIGLQIEIDHSDLENIVRSISRDLPSVEKIASSISSTCASIIFEGIMIEGMLYTYIGKIGLSELLSDKDKLNIRDNVVFDVSREAAEHIVSNDQESRRLQEALDEIDPAIAELPSWDYLTRDHGRSYSARLRGLGDIAEQLIQAAKGVSSKVDFDAAVAGVKARIAANVKELENTESPIPFIAFGGSARLIPQFVFDIIETIAAKNVVHFRETRAAIGYEEAAQLLQLKTKRGGAERLATVQRTVKGLLGVDVDAFEPEMGDSRRIRPYSRRVAEMDVDNFLVEANGAGIREALRIVLDIELKSPDVVLIEEPEVHLHPGLERSLHSYLVSKKIESQIFVSTHSTNFIDVSDVQSVFVITRDENKISKIEQISSKEDLLMIPDEIGLKPSTILMFDRLVFVEGPSDEAIIISIANKMGIDLLQQGTAFVKMGGASALPHYAAEATLELLSRRQIPMLFVIDRDEQTKEDIEKILSRLGNRAKAYSLKRRELENYMLDPDAISNAIKLKAAHSELDDKDLPSGADVSARIHAIAVEMKDEVKRLVIERRVLKPIYPSMEKGSAEEKISKCQQHLKNVAVAAREKIQEIESDIDSRWESEMMNLVPGSSVLSMLYEEYGFKFDKVKDGRRIAESMSATRVERDLSDLVGQIGKLGR
jgi:putative ATP-dependent endonuclease of the OLD family